LSSLLTQIIIFMAALKMLMIPQELVAGVQGAMQGWSAPDLSP